MSKKIIDLKWSSDKKRTIEDFVPKEIVAVVWSDAISKTRVSKEEINNNPIQLPICITYGIVYKEDNKNILIMTEDANGEIDYTAFRKGCRDKIFRYQLVGEIK